MNQPPHPPRTIVGVQLHHSVTLGDATRHAANMLTALDSVARRTTDDEVGDLIERLRPLVRELSVARAAADMRLRLHQSDPDFAEYVEGDRPWPDERPDGFVARCRCHDRCLFHDVGRGTEADCNCHKACRRHEGRAA